MKLQFSVNDTHVWIIRKLIFTHHIQLLKLSDRVTSIRHHLTEENVMALRELAAVSDYMMPNYTEACFLTGTAYKEEGLPEEELKELLLRLHRLSGGTVIITSVLSEGKNLVAVYDRQDGSFAFLPYRQIPVRIVGTGDIFSAFFMAHILEGRPVTEAVQQTMDTIRDMILT